MNDARVNRYKPRIRLFNTSSSVRWAVVRTNIKDVYAYRKGEDKCNCTYATDYVNRLTDETRSKMAQISISQYRVECESVIGELISYRYR